MVTLGKVSLTKNFVFGKIFDAGLLNIISRFHLHFGLIK